jgi:hypothetical protein
MQLGAASLCCCAVTLNAQWNNTSANSQSYTGTANWVDGVVNDRLVGTVDAVDTLLDTASFAAGSTTVYTGLFDARKLSVGQSVSGAGIPGGATITAINNAGQITISAPTEAAGSALTVTGWGRYNFDLGAWNFNVDANHTMTGDFVFANNDMQNTTFTPNTVKWTFTAPKVNFVVDVGGVGTTSPFFTFGAASRRLSLDFTGATAHFYIDPSSGSSVGRDIRTVDTVTFAVSATNIGSLTKSGAGVVRLGGADVQVWTITGSGAVTIDGGMLQVASDGQVINGPRLQDAGRYDVMNRGSALYVDSSNYNITGSNWTWSGSQVMRVNLLDNAPINLYSAALAGRGNNGAVVDGVTVSDQAVGAVTLKSGRNVIGLANSGTNYTLTLASLTRENYATLNIFGNGIGLSSGNGSGFIKLGSDGNIEAGLVGGGGAEGSKTVSVLPWATGISSDGISSMYGQTWLAGDSYQYAATDLLTYTSAGGFRPLTVSEYATSFTEALGVGAAANVSLSANASLTTTQTINALRMTAGSHTIGDTLTITSGVLISTVNITLGGNGTIDTGSNALIIYGRYNLNLNVAELTNSVAANAPGLILAQSGTTILFGTGNYGGYTLVQGNALLKNAGAITNSELRVDNGGALTVDVMSSGKVEVTKLSGNGTVNFTETTTSQLNIGGTAGAARTITVNNGGSIAPGDVSGALTAGTLLLGDGVNGLRFMAGSILDLDVLDATRGDMISAFNPDGASLTFDSGAIVRLNLSGFTPADGDNWLLATGFASINISDIIFQDQLDSVLEDYQLTALNNNLFLTYNIPEPSVWLLLTIGALTLTMTHLIRKQVLSRE